MEERTAEEYFSKIDSIITLLNDLGSDVSEDDVVTYAINGLSDKYGSLAQIIAHKDPFPDLATVRSMVTTEEMRIRSKPSNLPSNNTSNAPQVLLAEANTNRDNTGRNTRERDTSSRINNRTTEVSRDLAGSRQSGYNSLMGPRPTIPTGLQSTPQQAAHYPFTPQQQALFTNTVQGSNVATGQETLLPNAFNTMTLQDPNNTNWNMDTGASSHLNSSTSNLSTIFNSCMYPSVLVGDGKSIPVTNTGHSTLPTPYKPLHLNNVLITPNIVKNLISVR
ncbi:hypothetical protein Tco_1075895 [Tanacetum coccineum]